MGFQENNRGIERGCAPPLVLQKRGRQTFEASGAAGGEGVGPLKDSAFSFR